MKKVYLIKEKLLKRTVGLRLKEINYEKGVYGKKSVSRNVQQQIRGVWKIKHFIFKFEVLKHPKIKKFRKI